MGSRRVQSFHWVRVGVIRASAASRFTEWPSSFARTPSPTPTRPARSNDVAHVRTGPRGPLVLGRSWAHVHLRRSDRRDAAAHTPQGPWDRPFLTRGAKKLGDYGSSRGSS